MVYFTVPYPHAGNEKDISDTTTLQYWLYLHEQFAETPLPGPAHNRQHASPGSNYERITVTKIVEEKWNERIEPMLRLTLHKLNLGFSIKRP